MSQFDLRSNLWAIVGGVTAVLGLFLSIGIVLYQRESKGLQVETISAAAVADLTDPASAALKLTFNDEPLSRVDAVTIEVANIGNIPIEAADFERAMALRFSESSVPLVVAVSERDPPNLVPTVVLNSGVIEISPMLLNPADHFRLNVVVRGKFEEPEVDSRIKGIRVVSRRTLPETNQSPVDRALRLSAPIVLTFFFGYFGLRFNPLFARRFTIHRNETLVYTMATFAALMWAWHSAVSSAALGYQSPSFWVLLSLCLFAEICGSAVGIRRRKNLLRSETESQATDRVASAD